MSNSTGDAGRQPEYRGGAVRRNSRTRSMGFPDTDVARLLSIAVTASDGVVAELRGLRSDVRELIAVTRWVSVNGVPHPTADTGAVPPMMTIDEAGQLLRTSRRALYMRIRRGLMPGVVRVGRRLMVNTDEFLRGLRRMPTLEESVFSKRR